MARKECRNIFEEETVNKIDEERPEGPVDFEELLSYHVILKKKLNLANDQITGNFNHNVLKSNDRNDNRNIIYNCIPITLKILKNLLPNSIKNNFTFMKTSSNGKRIGFCHCLALGRVISIDIDSKRTKYILDDGTETLELLAFQQNHKLHAKRLQQLQDQLEAELNFQFNDLMNYENNNTTLNDKTIELISSNDVENQQEDKKRCQDKDQYCKKDNHSSNQQQLIESLKNILHLIRLQINEISEIAVGDSVIVYGKPKYFNNTVSLYIDGISTVKPYNEDGKGSNSIYYNNHKLPNNSDLEIDFKDILINFYEKLNILCNEQ